MCNLKKSLSALALILSVAPASANIITQFETQFQTDFVTAGVGGLRGTGAGNISLTGVSGNVNKAYLYWHGPTNSNDPAFNANLTLNGNAVNGTNIGFSADNNWGQLNSQAYRADVTSLVGADGTYSISGLSPDNTNGASLVVYFDDGDASNNRDVVTFDGNDSNQFNPFDTPGWDITLDGINYTSGSASIVLGVSDGQAFDSGQFFLNGISLLPPNPFAGVSVPQSIGTTVSNGGLWDITTVDITSFLSPGLNSLNLTHSASNDALAAIHISVDLPAGAAPNPPTAAISNPASLTLIGLGLGGLGWRRRKNV